MNWQDLIEQSQNAATTLKPADNSLMPLPELAVIQVKGEEASGFLQNLLTNDVLQLSHNQAQLTGLCNAKGRLLAVFQLLNRSENDFILLLPQDVATVIAQRLTLFKLRSKVDIYIASNEWAVLGWLNPQTDIVLPTEAGHGINHEQSLIIRQAGDIARYLVITKPAFVSTFIASLADITIVAPANWSLQDILAGIPTIFDASKEKFTPQQLNLDLIGGVSFKKGCYPGQEVVARLHYLGTPSRRLFLAELDTNKNMAANMTVTNSSTEVQGHVVRAQTAENRCFCLVTVKLSALDNALAIDGVTITQLIPLAEID